MLGGGSSCLLVILDPGLGEILRWLGQEIEKTIDEEILVNLLAVRSAAIDVEEIAKVLEPGICQLPGLFAVLQLLHTRRSEYVRKYRANDEPVQ